MSMDISEGPSVPRVIGQYEPSYQEFLLHTKNYVVQYNQLYLTRLVLMREHMIRRAHAKWGAQVPVLEKLIDLQGFSTENTDVVLIGMLSKELKLRGSVLDNSATESGIASSIRPLTALVSDRDTIIMEDHSGRVSLDGAIKTAIHHLVTGVVVAVKGKLNEDGILIATEWLYSYELRPVELPTRQPSFDVTNGKYVLLVSGLLIGSTEANDVHDLSVQQLVDFVCGRYGDAQMSALASRIARVVIAGNSVVPTDPLQLKEKFGTQKYKASLSTPSKQFDIWVAQLLSSCFVDVMPGATDPANIAVPQQPFHPCLFPHSSRYTSLERVSNPYQYRLDGVSVLGHSGQPVRDISRLTHGDMFQWATPHHVDEEAAVEVDPKPKRLKVDFQSATRRLDVLKKTLEWGHLCPTAPDTLPSYPFADRDPYILTDRNMPQVLFAGNQPGYASELVTVHDGIGPDRRVRVISVPEFRSTGTIVLCNLNDPELSCIPITFR
eukprot:gene3941-2802_t